MLLKTLRSCHSFTLESLKASYWQGKNVSSWVGHLRPPLHIIKPHTSTSPFTLSHTPAASLPKTVSYTSVCIWSWSSLCDNEFAPTKPDKLFKATVLDQRLHREVLTISPSSWALIYAPGSDSHHFRKIAERSERGHNETAMGWVSWMCPYNLSLINPSDNLLRFLTHLHKA